MKTAFDLKKIKGRIIELWENGHLGPSIIEALWCGNHFVPFECEMWDYKEAVDQDASSMAKTILHITSFYNSYGGYLIYGVREMEKDARFVPCGFDPDTLDRKQLIAKTRNYTGADIGIAYEKVDTMLGGNHFTFGILYIPKRPQYQSPATFIKNGPQKPNSNDLVFKSGKAYFRRGDECCPATETDDYGFLFSARQHILFTSGKEHTARATCRNPQPFRRRLHRNVCLDGT